MNHKQAISLCSIFFCLFAAGCASPSEITETPPVAVATEEEAEPTPDLGLITESSLEDYLTLSQLSAAIRSGEVDVGDEYGMGVDERFHTIHAQMIGMGCAQCHVPDALEEVAPAAQGAPGIVDRRTCLGCHLNGPAMALYEPKE